MTKVDEITAMDQSWSGQHLYEDIIEARKNMPGLFSPSKTKEKKRNYILHKVK